MSDCGGCSGLGAHQRWCPVAVGEQASRLGRWSEQADALGDQVGGNNPAAANALYHASTLLREQATEIALRRIAKDIAREVLGD